MNEMESKAQNFFQKLHYTKNVFGHLSDFSTAKRIAEYIINVARSIYIGREPVFYWFANHHFIETRVHSAAAAFLLIICRWANAQSLKLGACVS